MPGWDYIERLVRVELPETTEAWFTSQGIARVGSMRQIEIANNIGGLESDVYMFFDPDEIEGDAPFKMTYADRVFLINGTEERELAFLKAGRPNIWNYPYGDPYSYYVVNNGKRQGKKIGVFPGATTYDGTGTISGASTTITGVGTLFTTELTVGQRIVYASQTRTVTAISSATSLTINSAFTSAPSGSAFTYGVKLLIRGRFLPKEYALDVRYLGAAELCTMISSTTQLSITKTLAGTPTAYTFSYATYTTPLALKTAILATSGLSGIEVKITEDTYSTDAVAIDVTDTIDIKSKWGTLFEEIQLDDGFNSLLVLGILCSMLRRDQDAYQSRVYMTEYQQQLIDLRRQHKAKTQPVPGSLSDAYPGPGGGIAITGPVTTP